jgi:hypothetical protein
VRIPNAALLGAKRNTGTRHPLTSKAKAGEKILLTGRPGMNILQPSVVVRPIGWAPLALRSVYRSICS